MSNTNMQTQGTGWQAKFLFKHRDEPKDEFIAITSDRDLIEMARAQLEQPEDERILHITGPIAGGNGGHNFKWSWHYIPDQWELVEISMEVCDATPHMVEEDLDYWLYTVKRFCPWNSCVIQEISSG